MKKIFLLIKLKNLMRKNLLPVLPILSSKKIVLKYLTWNHLFSEKKTNDYLKKINFVIMAGGKGTRLTFTKVLPKPLLPINDKPVIQHIIEKFLNYGAKNFFISVNYKKVFF